MLASLCWCLDGPNWKQIQCITFRLAYQGWPTKAMFSKHCVGVHTRLKKKIKHIFPQQLHVFLFQLIPIYVKEIFETHFLKKYLFPFCKSSVVLSDLFLLSYFRLSKELQRPRSGSLSSWHFKISDDLPRLPHKQAQAQTR